ncbi:acyloxyacyl hydrolase [Desulfovibrio ferrophilus]|uniref:Lipid A 3-O-deacylase-related protein n=1 Tax=Desulfovibrio ferrophilus TaxID=241368 RepID=A0A2Z6B0Z6_9BACT|nr:acyloxyacyl hydrolase [Desulfovibrio ferrophilus]BBD09118.1 lipid A 3-O-deacylase-related protein [Desulfovibrio ferrophilus]
MRRFCAIAAIVCIMITVGMDLTASATEVVSEARIGVLAHDVPFVSFNRESGADLNAEVLFVSPVFLQAIGAPRPHIGGSLNVTGDTSQVYAGLTWDGQLGRGFFVEGMFGGALHDGKLDTDESDRKSLGTSLLFRLGVALGYALNERMNVLLVVDHVSNANLASSNEGLDTIGLKLGYKF